MMSRSEHLAWAKARALEYLPDDPVQAMTSMFSDLKKHPELEAHPAMALGATGLMSGLFASPEECRKYIEGFN